MGGGIIIVVSVEIIGKNSMLRCDIIMKRLPCYNAITVFQCFGTPIIYIYRDIMLTIYWLLLPNKAFIPHYACLGLVPVSWPSYNGNLAVVDHLGSYRLCPHKCKSWRTWQIPAIQSPWWIAKSSRPQRQGLWWYHQEWSGWMYLSISDSGEWPSGATC